MADFRKLLLALTVVTLMFTTVASAQLPYSCNATAVPTLVRSEGIAELAGDLLLVCTGQVPTAGIQANVRVRLNTNITSNVLSGSILDAILVLNELTQTRRGPDTPYGTVYQGLKISDTEVEFLGVVLAAAGSSGAQTLRITNIRANASALGSSATVFATVNITGSTTVPVNNNSLVVADTRPGLKFSVTAGTYKNCEAPSGPLYLTFAEGFASAFREKGTAYAAQTYTPPPPGGVTGNRVAGGAYPNESGFNPGDLTAGAPLVGSTSIGQATQGTRLYARLSGVPSGATMTVPWAITTASGLVATAVTGAASDGSGGSLATSGTVSVTTMVVYEVTASPLLSLASSDTVSVPVSVSYSVPGPLGSAMAKGSFAPLSTVFTASASAPEPRFVDNASDATVLTIGPCRTILLFPFITNQAGFDTGLALSNTSKDPIGTTNQSGVCKWYFYGDVNGGPPPAAAVTTGSIAAGTSVAVPLSNVVPGFQGYAIAICEFQFAHGYAFISDANASVLAQGYLALIIPDRSGGRLPQDSSLNAAANHGELLGN